MANTIWPEPLSAHVSGLYEGFKSQPLSERLHSIVRAHAVAGHWDNQRRFVSHQARQQKAAAVSYFVLYILVVFNAS